MYSKYPTVPTANKNVRRNHVVDSCFECGDYDSHCGSDNTLGCLDLFGFTFFRNERNRHYRQLNTSVFMPLSTLELRSSYEYNFIPDDFRRTIGMPDTNSRIYTNAIRHMECDNRELPRILTDIISMMQAHDQLIISLDNQIKHTIITRLAKSNLSPVRMGNRYNYDFDRVYLYLSRVWRTAFSQTREERVEHHITNSSPRRDAEGTFWFDGLVLGSGTEQEFMTMRAILNEILRDDAIMNRLSELDVSLTRLSAQTLRIRTLTLGLVNLIQQGHYNTRIGGCCTRRSLMRGI